MGVNWSRACATAANYSNNVRLTNAYSYGGVTVSPRVAHSNMTKSSNRHSFTKNNSLLIFVSNESNFVCCSTRFAILFGNASRLLQMPCCYMGFTRFQVFLFIISSVYSGTLLLRCTAISIMRAFAVQFIFACCSWLRLPKADRAKM